MNSAQSLFYRLVRDFTQNKFKEVFKEKYPEFVDDYGHPYYQTIDMITKQPKNPNKSKKNIFCMGFVLDEELISIAQSINYEEYGWFKDCIYHMEKLENCFPAMIVTIHKNDLIGAIAEEDMGEFDKYLRCAFDPEYRAAQERMRYAVVVSNTEQLNTLEMIEHTDKKDELFNLGVAFGYTSDDIVRLYNYKAPVSEIGEVYTDRQCVISDDRIFIPSNESGIYVCISKNPYDAFWASSGNGYQSCFSLDSSYWGVRASPMLMTTKGFYMIYLTRGCWQKFSLFKEKKLKCPNMQIRAWAYMKDGTLHIGRTFGKDEWTSDRFFEAIKGAFRYSIQDTVLDRNEEYLNYVHKYKTYLDDISIKRDAIEYKRLRGDRSFTNGAGRNLTPHDICKKVTFKEGYVPKADEFYQIYNGKIVTVKYSPKSHLICEHTHWVDKYLDRECFKTIIIDILGDNDCIIREATKEACGESFYGIRISEAINFKEGYGCLDEWARDHGTTVVTRTIVEDKLEIKVYYGEQQ